MSEFDTTSLFPLPLNVFEEFMFSDGAKEYPMLFYLQVRLKGTVDRAMLAAAVSEAFRRHPLLNCHVSRIRGRLCWVWAGENFPEANWDVDQWQGEQPWDKPIDLTSETGLRVWAQQTADYAELTLQYHHTCCDGIGAAQFLQDVALGYAREYAIVHGESAPPELQAVDLALLKTRNAQEVRRVANLSGSVLRRMQIVLKYTVRYLRQEKIPFVVEPQRHHQPASGVDIRTIDLSRQQTRSLRDLAKHHNASLNDLLVRELMLLATSWNSEIKKVQAKRWSWRQPTVCVLVPTSLRGSQDSELPACNVVSYIFMSRSVKMTANPDLLLDSITDEMQKAHKFQAGWFFVQALQTLKRIPGGLSLIMRSTSRSCMSTTVLSHMGNLLNAIGSRLPRENGQIRMGNLLVTDIYGVPPIRQGTPVVFSSMMIGGCLKICVRCCVRHFSEADVGLLVDRFSSQLRQLGRPTPSTQSTQDLETTTRQVEVSHR